VELSDKALAAGASHRGVSEAYRCSASAVSRHALNHLKPRVSVALAQSHSLTDDDIVAGLLRLMNETEEVLQTAKAEGLDGRLVLAAVKEARECLRSLVQFRTAFQEPDVEVMITALGQVLPMYPEAAMALSEAMTDLGDREAGHVLALAASRNLAS